MKINLKDYLDERERMLSYQSIVGPVITISRNYGCDEESVVKSLITKLNNLQGGLKPYPWKYIDKEILEDAARELGMKAFDVDHRVLLHNAEVVSEWLSGFTQHYKLPDTKILDKVKEIITTYGKKGNVIIVGRGGIGVTKSMENSLHIKLTAPLAHRIKTISHVKGISSIEAEQLANRVDKDRKAWAEHLIEKDLDPSVFDVIYNMETTSVDEITDMIVALLQKRGLVSVNSRALKSA